ncbi:MAG TPA: hypothetical protein PLP42_21295 [Acidobacteriota bacterium]|nr:hypothetical protein [Acidobacteriota bacterium]
MYFHRILAVGVVCACLSPLTLVRAQQNEVCIPQFVVGTSEGFRWETTLMFFNQQSADVNSQWSLFNAAGQPIGATFREQLGQGDPTTIDATGQFTPSPIASGRARSFRFSSEEALQIGFLLITSDAEMTTHARLHLFDDQGNLISETAVIPGPSFTAGAFFVDATDEQLTGLALTNTSPTTPTNCTLKLFSEASNDQIGDDVTITIAPRNQNSQLVQEIFGESFLENEAGFVLINCDQPVCALAMQVRGVTATQIPVANAPAPAPAPPATP